MKIDIAQIEMIDYKLREILIWLEESTRCEFTLTSLYRMSDKGVHGTLPCRGADIRCKEQIWGEKLEEYINSNWGYDPDRRNLKVALFHGNPLHLHIQVHPYTFKKGKYE